MDANRIVWALAIIIGLVLLVMMGMGIYFPGMPILMVVLLVSGAVMSMHYRPPKVKVHKSTAQTKSCTMCGDMVRADVETCPHCGEKIL